MTGIKKFIGERHFTLGELVDIGRRLSEEQLINMELFGAVEQAEKEIVWRLRGAVELVKPLTHLVPENLLLDLDRAEEQLKAPRRGEAGRFGGKAHPDGRTLPKAGTILQKQHRFQGYRWERIAKEDGSYRYRTNEVFRFLVVEQPSLLLRLDEPNGPIYRSPSAAARRATRAQVNGWEYFEID